MVFAQRTETSVGVWPNLAWMRFLGGTPTTISLFLAGKRKLRPALAVRLVEGLERAFVRKGSRLDTVFFIENPDGRPDA